MPADSPPTALPPGQGTPATPPDRAPENRLAMLAHALRDPLNAIAAAVEVLNRMPADSVLAIRAREIISNQVERMAATIAELTAEDGAAGERRTPPRTVP